MTMELTRFYTPGLAQVAYGVADPRTKQAAIIDPRRDVDEYLTWASDRGYGIVAILETHVHADFVSGARELAEATGAPVYAGRIGQTAFPHQPLDDGDTVPVGQLTLQALWSPGHTPEHLSYLLFDPRRGDAAVALFSGDVLFAGEVGRPDLLGEEAQQRLVRQLYETVTDRLAALPDDLIVHPGHGAGSPCGKKIGDAARTTIGQEKYFNYAFNTGSREAFIDAIMAGMPRPPAYYPAMKRVNREGPALLRDLPAGEPRSPEEIEARQAAGTLIIDARDAGEFAVGHIPDAVNVGLGASFAIWAGWLTPYDREVALVLPDDARYEEARTDLRRIGIDNVAGYLEGGMAAWRSSGRPVATVAEMSVAELASRLELEDDDLQVLDVRDATERAEGHILGSRHQFAGALAQGAAAGGDAEKPVAVICGTGYRSSLAASLLQRQGLTRVITVPEGMTGWQAANLPVARP
jgi:hydroxyacylglutathione hydrolase